jgi:hypothetical protein
MFRASLAAARMLSRAFSVGFICVVGYGLKLLGVLRLLIPLLRVACFFLLSVLFLSFFWFFSTVSRVFPLTFG